MIIIRGRTHYAHLHGFIINECEKESRILLLSCEWLYHASTIIIWFDGHMILDSYKSFLIIVLILASPAFLSFFKKKKQKKNLFEAQRLVWSLLLTFDWKARAQHLLIPKFLGDFGDARASMSRQNFIIMSPVCF